MAADIVGEPVVVGAISFPVVTVDGGDVGVAGLDADCFSFFEARSASLRSWASYGDGCDLKNVATRELITVVKP